MTRLHRHRRQARKRGVTLIEILVAIGIALLLAGGMIMGVGALSGARLRESSTLVAGAIRVAYNHANATSRPTRVVFDIKERTIHIEDTEGRMLLQSGDRTGGAEAATELEKEVVEEAERIVEGPRAPRPMFRPVKKLLGFDTEGKGAKHLASKIYFRQIEVDHEDGAVTEGRVYLYFWPGGQTELAAIQLQKSNLDDVPDSSIITVLVSPLTGKVKILGGRVDMPRPRNDEEASDREDNG